MSRAGVFIQVRLASTRLPEKALLPLAGKSVIAHSMEALMPLPVDVRVLVTDTESVSRLTPEAEAYGYEVFAGDPEDVLDRYCSAANRYRIDTIVRATGDNPLTSGKMAKRALDLYYRSNADYAGISGTPYGTGVEVLSAKALNDLRARSTDGYEREHVSPGLYRHPERYNVVIESAPAELTMPDLRVTLDTPSDYEYISGVYRNVYRGMPIEISDLIAYGQRHQKHSA